MTSEERRAAALMGSNQELIDYLDEELGNTPPPAPLRPYEPHQQILSSSFAPRPIAAPPYVGHRLNRNRV